METRTLGRNGPRISRLTLGTMTFGSQNSPDEAFAILDKAVEMGINAINTSEIYPSPVKPETIGRTEEIVGDWLDANRSTRDKLVLMCKLGGHGRPYLRNGEPLTAANLNDAVNGTLSRLKTDYIDVLQLHWPQRPNPHFASIWNFAPSQDSAKEHDALQAWLETVDGLVKRGVVRHIGASLESAWGLNAYAKLADAHALPRVVATEGEYNLIRWQAEIEVAETCLLEGIGFLAVSTLAMGILSGKYNNGALPEGSRMTLNRSTAAPALTPAKLAAAEAYTEAALKHGLAPATMATAWALAAPFVTSVVVGATKAAHLESAYQAAELKLSADTLADLQALRRAHAMVF